MTSVSLDKCCLIDWMTNNVWQRVHRRHSNEKGKLWLICLLLYVLTHLLIWCHNSHHVLKIRHISTKWLNSKTWETYVIWRPSCRALVNSWDLLATASESLNLHLLFPPALNVQDPLQLHLLHECLRTSWISTSSNPPGSLWANMRVLLTHPAGCRISRCCSVLQAKTFSSSYTQPQTSACAWPPLHLTYRHLCCQFSTSTNTNKGPILICIQNNAGSVASVLLNSVTIPWPRSCSIEVKVLDRFSAWVVRWLRPGSFIWPGALSRTRGP